MLGFYAVSSLAVSELEEKVQLLVAEAFQANTVSTARVFQRQLTAAKSALTLNTITTGEIEQKQDLTVINTVTQNSVTADRIFQSMSPQGFNPQSIPTLTLAELIDGSWINITRYEGTGEWR